MGGKAFQQSLGIKGNRLDACQYHLIGQKIHPALEKLFGQVHLVRAYHNKSTFGDQDWIVSKVLHQNFGSLKKQLYEKFHLDDKLIHQNSNVYSLLIDGFQIDISLVSEKYFDACFFYMDDSPAGNALGKLYHKFGASYGVKGLYYTLRDNHNTYKLGEIELSLDNSKICNFLGLDYVKKDNGFKEEEDIFQWICSSKYFDHRIFAFENMNHIARVRDRKRPDYQRLLKYIDERFKGKVYDFPLKTDGVNILNDYFPESNLLEKIQELKNRETQRKEISGKFNGHLIMEITGAKGKELSQIMYNYKDYRNIFSDFKTFEDYLAHSESEKIKIDFSNWWQSTQSI